MVSAQIKTIQTRRRLEGLKRFTFDEEVIEIIPTITLIMMNPG